MAQEDRDWRARKVRDSLLERLAELNSIEAALKLAHRDVPPAGQPGHEYHSNLIFFLERAIVPDGAGRSELEAYRDFLQRCEGANGLKPGMNELMQGKLREAIEKSRPLS